QVVAAQREERWRKILQANAVAHHAAHCRARRKLTALRFGYTIEKNILGDLVEAGRRIKAAWQMQSCKHRRIHRARMTPEAAALIVDDIERSSRSLHALQHGEDLRCVLGVTLLKPVGM